MSTHGRARRGPSGQFAFAVVITLVASVVVVVALRSIPAAVKPTLRPPSTNLTRLP